MDLKKFGGYIKEVELGEYCCYFTYTYKAALHTTKVYGDQSSLFVYIWREEFCFLERIIWISKRYTNQPNAIECLITTFLMIPQGSQRSQPQSVPLHHLRKRAFEYQEDLQLLLCEGVVEIRDLWI